jgi:hypothetical protein
MLTSHNTDGSSQLRKRLFEGAQGRSEGIQEARRPSGAAASGNSRGRLVPVGWFRLLMAMGLCVGPVMGETLEMKVMEIEGRLIEATLKPAFAADRDALDEVVGKLSAIGPDRGVHHLANLKVESQRGMLNASARDLKRHDRLPGRRRGFSVGPDLTWRLQHDERVLTVQMQATLEMAPLYQFELIHPADGRWSLSAAVRGVRGMVMVFERVEGRPVPADAPSREWLAASLSTARPGAFDAKEPWRMVVDPKGPGSAIIRIQTPREGGKTGKVAADLNRYSEAQQTYSDSVVTFTTGPGSGPMAGNKVILCDFEIPIDRRPGKVIRWNGEGQVKLDPGTMIADGMVKATEWHDERTEKGFSSTAQKLKKEPECHVRGMVIKVR